MGPKPFTLCGLALTLLATVSAPTVSAEAQVARTVHECSNAEADAAETEAAALSGWEQLQRSFSRYGPCDDGAIAEGWSDTVVRLLTQRWSTLPALARLAAKDHEFEKFVLKHVDELMTSDEARQIVVNAKTRCPRSARALCRKL